MLVDIAAGLPEGAVERVFGHVTGERLRLCPAPVVGPDVDRDIVDVRAVVQAGEELDVVVGSHRPFVAGADHVVGVD